MDPLRFPKLALVAFLVLFLALGDVAVTTVGAEKGICNMTEQDLEACKPAASGSDPAPPSAECCDALKNADLPCLCSYKNSAVLPALGVDPDLAMQLPDKCGLKTPASC